MHGLISFIVHPDYLDHPDAVRAYETLLRPLADLRANRGLWIRSAGRVRHAMRLEGTADGWRISGEGADRARIAYASLDGVYKF